MSAPLETLSAAAFAHDLRPQADQDDITCTRLIPNIDRILERLRIHRAEVDREFERKQAALPPERPDAAPGEKSLALYPIGFCREIRDGVWARAIADPEFQALIGRDVVVKKIFVLLKGQFFQNAAQLGNLYVDVANDTVWRDKPKLEWLRIEDVAYENLESWPRFYEVSRRYLGLELYPNLLFPLAFPLAPFFAIRPGGRLDLLYAQDSIFLKDLTQDMRRTCELLADRALMARRLPEVYADRVRASCGGNLLDAFPLEFAPSTREEIRATVVEEFIALGKLPTAQAQTTIQHYVKLVGAASKRLHNLHIVADPATLTELRRTGAAPDPEKLRREGCPCYPL